MLVKYTKLELNEYYCIHAVKQITSTHIFVTLRAINLVSVCVCVGRRCGL